MRRSLRLSELAGRGETRARLLVSRRGGITVVPMGADIGPQLFWMVSLPQAPPAASYLKSGVPVTTPLLSRGRAIDCKRTAIDARTPISQGRRRSNFVGWAQGAGLHIERNVRRR
jgi:hypothetical protein